MRRSLTRLLCGMGLCTVLGCAVGGKSFQYESGSRTPFFGLQLLERKPKEPQIYRSIQQTTPEGEIAVPLEFAIDEEPPSRWKKWLPGSAPQPRIALPRTDDRPSAPAVGVAKSASFE